MDIQPPKAMHKKYPFALPDAVTATSCMCTYNATGRHSFADMRVDDSCAVLAQPLGSVKIWIAFRPEKLGKRALKRDDEFYKNLVKTMMWESGAPCEDSIPDTEKSTVNPTKSSAKWPPHIVRGHGQSLTLSSRKPNSLKTASILHAQRIIKVYISHPDINTLFIPCAEKEKTKKHKEKKEKEVLVHYHGSKKLVGKWNQLAKKVAKWTGKDPPPLLVMQELKNTKPRMVIKRAINVSAPRYMTRSRSLV